MSRSSPRLLPWGMAAAVLAAATAAAIAMRDVGEVDESRDAAPSSTATGAPDQAWLGSPTTWVARLVDAETTGREQEARDALVAMGDAALPALLEAMRNRRSPNVARAARLYGSLEGASVEACVALLREGRFDAGCEALAAMGPRARDAATALTEAMAGDSRSHALAAVALWRVTGDAEPALAWFREALSGETPGDVLSEVERLGPAAAPLVPDLVRLLDDDALWWATLDCLSAIGPGAAAAVPRLVEWVRTQSAEEHSRFFDGGGPMPRNALAGAHTLAALGDDGLDALEVLLLDPSIVPSVGFAWSGVDPATAQRRLVRRLSTPNAQARVRVLDALDLHAEAMDDSAFGPVAVLLRDSDLSVAEAATDLATAAISLGRAIATLRPALLSALSDPRPEVRVVSLYALSMLTTEDAVVAAVADRLRDSDLRVRRAAASALIDARLDAETRKLVDELNGVLPDAVDHAGDVERLASKTTLSADDLATVQGALDGDNPEFASAGTLVVASHGLSTPEIVDGLQRWAREPTAVGVDAIAALGVVTGDRERAASSLRRWLLAAREGGSPNASADRGWRAFHALDRMPRGVLGVRTAMEEAAESEELLPALRAEARRWLAEHPSTPR